MATRKPRNTNTATTRHDTGGPTGNAVDDRPSGQRGRRRSGRADTAPPPRKDLANLGGMETLALLDQPERWEALSPELLDRLLSFAVGKYGMHDVPGLDTKIIELYPVYASRVPDESRQALAAAVRDSIKTGDLAQRALFPFFALDPEAHIAAMAALDAAVLAPLEGGDPLTGPKRLLEFFRSGAATNRAAIFAGLLLLGDRRVTALLRDARDELSSQEATVVNMSWSGLVSAAAVEFWLEWLEELPGDVTDSLFGCAASALRGIPTTMRVPEVLDIERVFPATSSPGEPVRIVGRWPFREYARGVIRRLRAVERREPEPKILPQVIEAWTARMN